MSRFFSQGATVPRIQLQSLTFKLFSFLIHLQATNTTHSNQTEVRMAENKRNLRTLAGSQFVAELPLIPQSELSNNSLGLECLLCQGKYDANTKNALRLPCGDSFHKDCVLLWLSEDERHQNTCPHCREVLFNKLATMFGSEYVAEVPTIVPGAIPDGFYDRACAICRIDFEADTEDAVQIPSCLHNFDRTCLEYWLSEFESAQNTCPICRHRLFVEDDNNKERPEITDPVHSLPPGGPQGLVIHPRLQPQPRPEIVAHSRAIFYSRTSQVNINDRPRRIPVSRRNRTDPQAQRQLFQNALDDLQARRRKELDEIFMGRWFEKNFRLGVKKDVHLYDRCNRNLLPARKNPQATLLTKEEELALFAALRSHSSTFVLKFDADIRVMWLVYCGSTEPYELRNTSGNWTADNNDWMLEGWHRKWGDFDAILGRWLRRGIEEWHQMRIKKG